MSRRIFLPSSNCAMKYVIMHSHSSFSRGYTQFSCLRSRGRLNMRGMRSIGARLSRLCVCRSSRLAYLVRNGLPHTAFLPSLLQSCLLRLSPVHTCSPISIHPTSHEMISLRTQFEHQRASLCIARCIIQSLQLLQPGYTGHSVNAAPRCPFKWEQGRC